MKRESTQVRVLGLPTLTVGVGMASRKAVNDKDDFLALDHIAFSNDNDLPLAEPDTGLAGHTRLQTTDGLKPLSKLVPGDRIRTGQNSHARIRHILTSPSTRSALTIRAPYFGLDQDLVLGASHCIKIKSEVAEYMFGVEEVLVPVWALKDNIRVNHVEIRSTDRLFSVQFDTDSDLHIGGCALESLSRQSGGALRRLSEHEARSFAQETRQGLFR